MISVTTLVERPSVEERRDMSAAVPLEGRLTVDSVVEVVDLRGRGMV